MPRAEAGLNGNPVVFIEGQKFQEYAHVPPVFHNFRGNRLEAAIYFCISAPQPPTLTLGPASCAIISGSTKEPEN
jgi:hypothetical protein